MFADNFGGTDPKYDLDSSGKVDFSDFFIFADNFGNREEVAKLIALAEQMLGLPKTTMLATATREEPNSCAADLSLGGVRPALLVQG